MKAAVLKGPNNLIVQDVPDPVIGEYDVLCETLAAAVCGGTDNHIVRNHPYFKVSFPCIIGHEGIGRVIKCGKMVKYLKEGDLVTRIFNRLPEGSGYSIQYGAFAEKSTAADWQAMKDDGIAEEKWTGCRVHRVIPPDSDPAASTMIITWRETLSFLKRIKAEAGNSMLIIGSGATALSFANHAKNIGIKTFVIGSPSRAELFYKMKVKIVLAYFEKSFVSTIRETGQDRFDIIIDTIGDSEYLNLVLPLLKDGGKAGLYGLDSFLDYRIAATAAPGDFTYYNGEFYDEASAHEEVMEYLSSGGLDAWNYLSKKHLYPLEKITEALDASYARKVMKSVVIF
ncbi:MAG: alcohol dehydrogenase catalytic domain-containing protein [Spirochaetes bacterium]|jgi:D-arabinose 1-dehydrogenase-like Zn-dependent alcohol dehydrogenase|nr:alcohol dehydrogenase catalytic domain-containing protein [Spirochaetota bacterium]